MSTLLYAVIKYLYVYNIILPKRKRNKNLTHHKRTKFYLFPFDSIDKKKIYSTYKHTRHILFGRMEKEGGWGC